MIFEEIGEPEKAVEAYKAALAIHPQMQGVLEAVKRIEAETAGQDL
jgi:Tfp pilus assembly protein PilF